MKVQIDNFDLESGSPSRMIHKLGIKIGLQSAIDHFTSEKTLSGTGFNDHIQTFEVVIILDDVECNVQFRIIFVNGFIISCIMVPSKVWILNRLNPRFQDCSDAGIVVCSQVGNLR